MCRIDYCDDFWTLSGVRVSKARKVHKCNECRREIAPGEQYRRTSALIEGQWDTFRACSHCMVAVAWLIKVCRGYVVEEVREELEEHAQEYPAVAEALTDFAQRMENKWRSDDGVLMPIPQPLPELVLVS